MTTKASVIQWNSEKAYGFVSADGIRYFLHVSALGPISRSPHTGDSVIIYSVKKTEKGFRVEKGLLEGVPLIPQKKNLQSQKSVNIHSYRPKKSFRNFMFTLCMILAVIFEIKNIIDNIGVSFSSGFSKYTANTSKAQQYTSKDEVAKFICDHGYLPPNYVSKEEGKQLYESKTGKSFRKWNFNPLTTLGVMIGGDSFSNREGLLPQDYYQEADVDYFGENRGTKRLVYSSNCNIYYTSDHYKSFTRLSF